MDPQGRKLASVRRVHSKQPIEGADSIELVLIDGWQVVAKIDEFRVGEQCVYFEIDSFLPTIAAFEFLRKACYKKIPGYGEGFRLKTAKLRGQLSQGLAVPLAGLLPPGQYEDGTDVTTLLSVRKYEVVPQVGRGPVGNLTEFPSFVPRTDQERVQNIFRTIVEKSELRTVPYEVTLKMDGSSMTVFLMNDRFGVCSRNYEIAAGSDDKNLYLQTAAKYNLEARLRALGRNIALQGEVMGPGIQKNRERLQALTFYLFDIVDIQLGRRLFPRERHELLAALNAAASGPDITHCPVIDPAFNFATFTDIKEVLAYAERPSLNHAIAEGVVLKSTVEPMFTFKIISNRYLLKCED